jgi:hypothetical protein
MRSKTVSGYCYVCYGIQIAFSYDFISSDFGAVPTLFYFFSSFLIRILKRRISWIDRDICGYDIS